MVKKKCVTDRNGSLKRDGGREGKRSRTIIKKMDRQKENKSSKKG